MHLFLTSSPCDDDVPDGCNLPCILDASNGFVDKMRERYQPGSGCVLIAAAPDNYNLNNEMAATFAGAFAWHGMDFGELTLIDWRTADLLPEAITHSGMVILGGGHVPTMHAFLEELHLRELLEGYEGVVMGISAGSMNCCGEIYAQPEEDGESIDPNYQRFLCGLHLTDVMVLPHYQRVKDTWLDGQRLFEDITIPDSCGRAFTVLVDGSYVLVEDGQATVYGESYRIADGVMAPLCGEGEKVNM